MSWWNATSMPKGRQHGSSAEPHRSSAEYSSLLLLTDTLVVDFGWYAVAGVLGGAFAIWEGRRMVHRPSYWHQNPAMSLHPNAQE